jgi:large subunit ribosomal protein L4e
MKVSIKDVQNKEVGKIDLPVQFQEEVRDDIIKRAVLVIESANRQPYGADPEAGKKHSTYMSRRRRNYRGSYGSGISRVPRKILNRRGRRMHWVGAFAPGTVGGRRAHPPKSTKKLLQNINKKERRFAIRSALSASMIKDVVSERGHKVPNDFPFVIDNSFEEIVKTKDLKLALLSLGFEEEFKRLEYKKIRAGKGKARGRRFKKKIGPLVVVSDECKLIKAAKNLKGFDVVKIKNINAKLLAPGAMPGRITLYTNSAIEKIKKENLFM